MSEIITNEKGEKFMIPTPSDEIFQNEFVITGDTAPLYIMEKMETLKNVGTITTYEGIPYTRKGWTHPVSLQILNIIKRMIKEVLKYPLMFLLHRKKKLLKSFNEIFDKAYNSYKIKPEYLCRPAYHFGKFLEETLIRIGISSDLAYETAFNLAQIIEADDVYRYRMQDLVGVINFEESSNKNIKRMLQALKEREIDGAVYQKIKHLRYFMFLLPELPFYRLKECKMDENDWHWCYFNSHAYKYGGMNKAIRKLEKFPEVASIVKC